MADEKAPSKLALARARSLFEYDPKEPTTVTLLGQRFTFPTEEAAAKFEDKSTYTLACQFDEHALEHQLRNYWTPGKESGIA